MTKLSDYLNGLTEDASPDTANDMLLEYDASAAASKKLKLATLLALASGGGLGADGWASADAMTYAGADSPTFTMTCAGDQTAKYYPGMRVKLTQTTVKYFIITAVAYSSSTTLTLYGGTDYTLANAAITSPYFSSAKAPAGFPLDPAKWTVETRNATTDTQASPTQNVWYNLGSRTIVIPIGAWHVSYQVTAQTSKVAAAELYTQVALSTGNNTGNDIDLVYAFCNTGTTARASCYRAKYLTLAAKATYYLNMRTEITNIANIYYVSDSAAMLIRATCAYL